MVAVLLVATTYVTLEVSSWWAIFYIPVVLVGMLLFIVWILVQTGIRSVTRGLNSEQKEATEQFIDKMQQLAEDLQTPPPVILYRVLKDVILRKNQQFLLGVTSRSLSLKSDFESLSTLFVVPSKS